jgi:hypothetical protein
VSGKLGFPIGKEKNGKITLYSYFGVGAQTEPTEWLRTLAGSFDLSDTDPKLFDKPVQLILEGLYAPVGLANGNAEADSKLYGYWGNKTPTEGLAELPTYTGALGFHLLGSAAGVVLGEGASKAIGLFLRFVGKKAGTAFSIVKGKLVKRVGSGAISPVEDREAKRLVSQFNKRFKTKTARAVPPLVARIQGKLNLYPKVIDPRTGRAIRFPSGIKGPVEKSLRVPWDSKNDRAAFIAEWHRRRYAVPRGGWSNYDIHHIQPRELGGTNDFWNLVPVERKTHQKLFNDFWEEFTGL